MRAFELQRANTGMWAPGMNLGMGGAANAMNFAAPTTSVPGFNGQVQGLLSPYTQNVIDASNTDIERQRTLRQQQNGADAARLGVFGGDRAAVAETETNRNFDDIRASNTANLLNTGFNNATNTAMGINSQNINSILQGAGINLSGSNTLANMAGQSAQYGANDVAGLLNTGGVQQGNAQQQNTFDYNEFLRQLQQRYQQQGAVNSTLSSVPHDTTNTQTSQIYSNPLAGIAGLGLGIASGNPMAMMSGVNGLLGGGSQSSGPMFGMTQRNASTWTPAPQTNWWGNA